MARKKTDMIDGGAGASSAKAGPEVAVSTLLGHLDLVSHQQAEGWALDIRYPDNAVALKFLVNGVPVGQILANRKREGLKEAGIGNGRNAFLFEFPGGLSLLKSYVIQVERVRDGAILANSPMTLEPAAR